MSEQLRPSDIFDLTTGDRLQPGSGVSNTEYEVVGIDETEDIMGQTHREFTLEVVESTDPGLSAGTRIQKQGENIYGWVRLTAPSEGVATSEQTMQPSSADRVPEIQRRTETAVNQLFGSSITQELTVDENKVQIDGYLEDDEFATYRERMDDIAEFERTSGGQGQNVVQEPALDEMGVPQDVNFRRAEGDGQYTPPEPLIDPAPQAENVDRGPNGQFVDDDRQPIDEFGRDPLAGLFDPFDRL